MLPKTKGGLIGLAIACTIAVLVTSLMLMAAISQVMQSNQGYFALLFHAVLWMVALLAMVASFSLVREFKPADEHPNN